ncbi:MAG: WD40 repeat domain-containing protein [Armatimonadota bacterium]
MSFLRSSKPGRLTRRTLLGAAAAGAGFASLRPAAAAPPSPVWAVAYSPDGKLLAAGRYREVLVWRLGDPGARPSIVWNEAPGPVRGLAWSPDGTRLAAATGRPGQTGEVAVIHGAHQPPLGGEYPVHLYKEHKDVVEGIAFASEGRVLLTAGLDDRALALQMEPRKPLATMGDHTGRVTAIAVSPNGKYVATGSLDRTVKIWSAADYLPLANVDGSVGPVTALVFIPGNDQFAVAGEEGNVRLFRVVEQRSGGQVGVNGAFVRQINGNRTPVNCLAVAAKGTLLAIGGEDRVVHLYDSANGRRLQQLKDSPEPIYGVALSPDASQVAAGSRDGKVRIWSAADGKLLHTL